MSLSQIRAHYKKVYRVNTKQLTEELHNLHNFDGLDSANDYVDSFGKETGEKLNRIATCVWQMVIGTMEQEGIDGDDLHDAFDAIFQQVAIAHFG